MNKRRMAEVLAAHAEGLTGGAQVMQRLNVTADERDRLSSLFQLAERLQQSMQPAVPSAAFVRSLGRELVDNARHQIAPAKRPRRAVVIGAAVLGSLVSIASVVGAIVFVVSRSRARARTLHAPVAG
ncbi:MAG: hypothetical protein ISS49_03245 [Anaerolineae bacterium]|nr:hypothetical protein [Anaerolineae bacterium]